MIDYQFYFITIPCRFCARVCKWTINNNVNVSRHSRRFRKTTPRTLYRKTHGRTLYNMAFNLRRIRCLATQTTAIGFHLMNQTGAFGSIFALWARLKLDIPPSPSPFLFHPLSIFAYFISASCDLRLDESTWYRKLQCFVDDRNVFLEWNYELKNSGNECRKLISKYKRTVFLEKTSLFSCRIMSVNFRQIAFLSRTRRVGHVEESRASLKILRLTGQSS